MNVGDTVWADYYGTKIPGVYLGECVAGVEVQVDPVGREALRADYLGPERDLWHPASVTLRPNLAQSLALVGDDQRRSFPDFTNAQALHRVLTTLTVDDLDGDPGDLIYDAYHLVLSTDMSDVLLNM